MKKELSYSKQVLYFYTINGISWFLTGILKLFDNKICMILATIIMVVALVYLIRFIVSNKESADEMAEAHEKSAMKAAYMIGHAVLLVFSIVFIDIYMEVMGKVIDWNRYISSLVLGYIGVLDIIVGLIFNHLEKE